MAKTASSRIVILIGLVLAIVLPAVGTARLAEHIEGVPLFLSREGFWWGLFAIVLLYVRVVERRPLASIGFKRPTWMTLAVGIGGAVVMAVAIGAGVQYVLTALHLARNQQAISALLSMPLWYRVLLVTRAAVVEETLFRGYGIERLQELTGSRWIAGLVTLALFSFGHLSYWGWTQIIVAGAAGLVLTLQYIWRRDLGANIITHWIIDALSVLLGA